MRITLTNDFHGTKCTLVTRENAPTRISETQRKKAKRTLCGMASCTCSGPFGYRGPQADCDGISDQWDCRTGKYDGGYIQQFVGCQICGSDDHRSAECTR